MLNEWIFDGIVCQQDCDRPGRACLTISCSLSSQAKEEATNIDVQMLLNTEILQRVSYCCNQVKVIEVSMQVKSV